MATQSLARTATPVKQTRYPPRMTELIRKSQPTPTAREKIRYAGRINNPASEYAARLASHWRYRQWEASRAAYSLAGLFILPAYLIFSLAVGVGCDLRISSVILGGYLVCLTGVAVRAKDCVAIYWSLYSFIPLVMLN